MAALRAGGGILASPSTYNSHLSSSSSSSNRKQVTVSPPASALKWPPAAVQPMSLNSKQQQEELHRQNRTKNPAFPSPSPLLTAEQIASRFGHEMTVAGLERLFSSLSGGDRHPPPPAGSSGRPVRVAYQGVRGSYCQEAAARAFSSFPVRCEAFPCAHMEEAFAALEDRLADRAIVPLENSIDGSIGRNFDLLLRHPAVQIVGEVVLPVNHCLLSLPGASRSQIRRVVSHPQALSHCRAKLEAMDLEVEEVPNAADAARIVSKNGIDDTAVIGSQIAAREFGLRVMEHNFQDQGGNYNRFLQLGLGVGVGVGVGPSSTNGKEGVDGEKNKMRREGSRKTTVAFSLANGVSDLFRAMWIFESRGMAVSRVEHRPNRSNPVRVAGDASYFDYVFILDVEGREADSGVEAAVSRLSEICGFVRVLGTYTCAAR